jgi:hypothetical protein
LERALAVCKKHKAKLVVAKLDRLSRNTRFLLTLIESGVDVLFADLPEVRGAMGKFILTQMAAIPSWKQASLASALRPRWRRRSSAACGLAQQALSAPNGTRRRQWPAPLTWRRSSAICSGRACR